MVWMPAFWASSGERRRTACPPTWIVPLSGVSAPERIFTNVDFPAPFCPARAWMLPRATDMSTPLSAWTPGYPLVIPAICTSTGASLRLGRAAQVESADMTATAGQKERRAARCEPVGRDVAGQQRPVEHVVDGHVRHRPDRLGGVVAVVARELAP